MPPRRTARVFRGFVLALLACGWSQPCLASTLEGRIGLPDGRPAAGAEVSILGRAGSTTTDDAGRFTWTPAPEPPFELIVVLAGGGLVKPLHVATLPESGPLMLVAEPAVEESVTVTAGLAPHVSPPPAAGTTLLTSREITLRAPANLVQALENVAGVASVSDGQAAVPAIRGFARGRTLILVDGARVSAERRVGPSATYLDPSVLESVEVARGPGSVAYGSDAFGGVIDARTRRAVPGSGTSGRLVADLGAGIPQRRVALEVAQGLDQGGLMVQAHFRDFDDYESPGGKVGNSGSRDFGARARFDHRLAAGTLSVSWQSDLGRDIERPRANSGTTRFFYPEENSHRVVAAWRAGPLGSWSSAGASAFLGGYTVVTDQDTLATADEPRSVERADVTARDFHVRGFAARPVRGIRLELGLDVNGRYGLEALDVRRRYDASGTLTREETDVSIEDARRTDYAGYATLRAAPGHHVVVDGGVRADHVATRNRGGYFGDRTTAQTAVSGFLAVGFSIAEGLAATGQVSRGFRDPVLSDRYYRGPTGRGFITGNPDLEPETSLQFDVALRYAASRWRGAVYAFEYRIEDLVERFETDPDSFYFRNRGSARMRGVEVEVQAEPVAGFTVELAGHLVRGEARDDGTPLDDVPPATLTLKLTRKLGPAFVQARGAVYAEDDRPGPAEQARAGYGLVDVAAGWHVSESVELRVLGRNLFDEPYRVSPDRRAVLAPGRSVLLTAVVAF